MAYELFSSKAAKFSSPQLTIRGGKIAFNADAGDILAKTGMGLCHILWDAATFKIGIQAIAKEDDDAFKVSIPEGRRGGTISAHSFLNYIQWRSKRPVIVDAHWNGAARLLEASLPKEYIGTADREAAKENPTKPRKKPLFI